MGKLVIISSPSGGGKNAIIRRLVELLPESTRFITTTTRSPRPQEIPGKDYFYVARDMFEQMITEKKLVEYNLYAGEYYGTEKEKLERVLEKYQYVFAALDVNGKRALEEKAIPHVSIFLLPESLDILKERIKARGGVGQASLEERLEAVDDELAQAHIYDLQVVNPQGNMESAVTQIVDYLGSLDKK